MGRIEYRLTICQLNNHFTRNNDLKSIKSLFKDDSQEATTLVELLTFSSSNFHQWPAETALAEPFAGDDEP